MSRLTGARSVFVDDFNMIAQGEHAVHEAVSVHGRARPMRTSTLPGLT